MQLSARLKAVAQCVSRGSTVADIGTDHAYLAIYLVEKGICPRVIAGDLNRGPLESAREAVLASGCGDRIELRLGDGLEVIHPGEVDTVVMAGMGGELITRALNKHSRVVHSLQKMILQPNVRPEKARQWLAEKNWGIVDEKLVQDNKKLYVVIAAEPGRGLLPEDELSLEVGPCLLEKKNDPLVRKLLAKKEKEYRKVLEGLARSTSERQAKKQERLLKLYESIKEALQHAPG